MNPEAIDSILGKHLEGRDGLISILEAIQNHYGYLPRAALQKVAEQTGRSLVDLYGVATFYRAFSLQPRGNHLVSACLGTACHVRGAPSIAQELEKQLGIQSGQTTSDREFTLETVNCLGACALGPVVVVDGHYFSSVNKARVKEILDKARAGLDKIEISTDQRVFPLDVSCPRCNHSLMDPEHPVDDLPSIRVTMSFNDRHGWLNLSSLYGSYNNDSLWEVPRDALPNIFCPHCHAELKGSSACPECGAPMVPILVRSGGILQICSRYGCKGHLLDLGI
jgi:NADH-quinone oxidoreductase subunit E